MTYQPGACDVELSKFFPYQRPFHQLIDFPEVGDDGLPREVTFGYVNFKNFDGSPRIVESCQIHLPPELHLIDWVPYPGGDGSTWRLRFWGGVDGMTYQASIRRFKITNQELLANPGYQPVELALVIRDAVETRPFVSILIVGMPIPPGAPAPADPNRLTEPTGVRGLVGGTWYSVTGKVGL